MEKLLGIGSLLNLERVKTYDFFFHFFFSTSILNVVVMEKWLAQQVASKHRNMRVSVLKWYL
jgi:hypothetical protein